MDPITNVKISGSTQTVDLSAHPRAVQTATLAVVKVLAEIYNISPDELDIRECGYAIGIASDHDDAWTLSPVIAALRVDGAIIEPVNPVLLRILADDAEPRRSVR